MIRVLLFTILSIPGLVGAYPMDGFAETGIRRLEQARLTQLGEIGGSRQPAGALLRTAEVDIRLRENTSDLPSASPALSARLRELLGDKSDRYSIAVLDLTGGAVGDYAEHRGDHRQNVGSVGKLLGALGLFQALADTWPESSRRAQVLRNTVVTADRFQRSDHHTIRLFDVASRELLRRPMQDGDRGSLWEYLDWMLSVSSNSAASMVMRDAMLLRHFGADYPVPESQIQPFFRETPRADATALFQRTFWQPVTHNGLSLEELRQGSFFTREGKRMVDGGGLSYGTARSLVRLLLLMEQGRLVDDWSSTQLKRLLYVTERRMRYASSPALNSAAVYFKSGSLYNCREEPGFQCGAYRGNVRNYMNSVAVVEQQQGELRLHYLVAVVSNVLRENSALDHQRLGTEIHRLIMDRHGLP